MSVVYAATWRRIFQEWTPSYPTGGLPGGLPRSPTASLPVRSLLLLIIIRLQTRDQRLLVYLVGPHSTGLHLSRLKWGRYYFINNPRYRISSALQLCQLQLQCNVQYKWRKDILENEWTMALSLRLLSLAGEWCMDVLNRDYRSTFQNVSTCTKDLSTHNFIHAHCINFAFPLTPTQRFTFKKMCMCPVGILYVPRGDFMCPSQDWNFISSKSIQDISTTWTPFSYIFKELSSDTKHMAVWSIWRWPTTNHIWT